jgi:hypothetical protein
MDLAGIFVKLNVHRRLVETTLASIQEDLHKAFTADQIYMQSFGYYTNL